MYEFSCLSQEIRLIFQFIVVYPAVDTNVRLPALQLNRHHSFTYIQNFRAFKIWEGQWNKEITFREGLNAYHVKHVIQIIFKNWNKKWLWWSLLSALGAITNYECEFQNRSPVGKFITCSKSHLFANMVRTVAWSTWCLKKKKRCLLNLRVMQLKYSRPGSFMPLLMSSFELT